MKKLLIIILLAMAGAIGATAQEATVKSFETAPMDVTAQQYARLDLHREKCAVVKVRVIADGVAFKGNLIGEPVENPGEYWVYLTGGTKQVQILSRSFLPFMYYFPAPLQGGVTYVLTLLAPQAAGGSAPQGPITSCNNSGDKNSSNSGDSIQEEIFTTPDLSLFQLKGHVKKCIIPYEGLGDEIYEFDKDGNLISPKYEKIERDANGAIIEYYDPERESTIRITWKNGKVKDVTELFDDGYNYSCYGYEYDENNNIVQMGIAHVAFPYNYSDYKFDEFGNWISRIEESNGTSVEEKRYITYYGSDAGQERLLEHYGQKKEEEIQRNFSR